MNANEATSPRTRPASTTSGSAQRPPRLLAAPSLQFDLAAELTSLRAESSWQLADRNARTLVQEAGLRIVLVGLKTGARLEEHRLEGLCTVYTVSGCIRHSVSGGTIDLPAGHVLVLDRGVAHNIEALDESAFLLTISG
jgi:quercetin dioxygenase-like cupin family protein